MLLRQTLSALAKAREATIADVDQNRDAEIDAMEPEDDEGDEAFERRKMSLRTSGPSEAAKEALEDFDVPYEEDSQQDAATRHIQLKLLLRLLKWESREADDLSHLIWTIPKAQLPGDLRGYIKIIDDFLINPLDPENGMSLSEMITKKAKPRKKPQISNMSASGTESDGAAAFSDPEVAAAIRGTRKKRSSKGRRKSRAAVIEGHELDDGEGPTRRRRLKRRKEAEEYRTAEFIEDSDDDEEANKAFFEREKRLREEMEKKGGLGNGLAERKTKEKKKRRKKGEEASASQSQASQVLTDDEDDLVATQATQVTRASTSSASDSEDEPLVAKTKPRTRAKPKVTAAKNKTEGRQAGSSERENRTPALSSSPPSSGSQDKSFKRKRGLLESSDDEAAASPSSSKQQGPPASRSRSRMQVVASDDED